MMLYHKLGECGGDKEEEEYNVHGRWEEQNTGAGAVTPNRVNWKGFKVITSASEPRGFTPSSFIASGSWLGSTSFPFFLGL
ncbi:hypothetical protein QYF36_009701 [Acer negundo]|nr:hypothetical protein QYF36_009701 [Acer negundo]